MVKRGGAHASTSSLGATPSPRVCLHAALQSHRAARRGFLPAASYLGTPGSAVGQQHGVRAPQAQHTIAWRGVGGARLAGTGGGHRPLLPPRGALNLGSSSYDSSSYGSDAHPLLMWARRVAHDAGRYKEIAQRLAVTLLMLLVMRAGHFIGLPGINPHTVPVMSAATEGERMMQAVYGQVRDLPASLFDLGISPSLNASIIISIILALPNAWFFPEPLTGWHAHLVAARKEGKAGESHINTWTNFIGLAIACFSGLIRAHELEPHALFPHWFVPRTALALVAGSAITQHCAKMITAHGIGSGTTLVIVTSVIAGYAQTLHTVVSALEMGGLSSATVIRAAVGLTGYLCLVAGSVYMCGSELRLPVVLYSSAQQTSAGAAGGQDNVERLFGMARKLMDGHSQRSDYFPIALNSSGMMPIIFASALYFGLLPQLSVFLGNNAMPGWIMSYWGLGPYALLVAVMEFLPLGGINAKEVADYLGTLNVGIKTVVPGEPTAEYVGRQTLAVKLWGGLALGILAAVAQGFDLLCKNALGVSLSTSSLLIIVGAVLQSTRQLDALTEGPRLQQRLDAEQGLIKSVLTL